VAQTLPVTQPTASEALTETHSKNTPDGYNDSSSIIELPRNGRLSHISHWLI